MIEIITSFDKRYYDIIGKACISSWLEYWPKELTLTCYVEGFELPPCDRIKQIPFNQLPQSYFDFQNSDENDRVKIFAKKAWSFIHAMENSTADYIVWLDADVISVDHLPMSLLEKILAPEVLSTHMGVTYDSVRDGRTGKWFVPETGFFGINTRHPQFKKFLSEYKRHYEEHDRGMLRRFYDNDVYGYVFEKLQAPGNDLCKDFTKGYKTPLRRTVLGPYLEHYKAKHSKDTFSQRQ
jgi:hypothetical protein